ncbi:hypothetical protein GGR56DRAFT_377918 [Xylariaceae sp. FL0804]|nr:hypothetical protein GGR56DRAFT_377918 [Xylariaceae sp. FL0804]
MSVPQTFFPFPRLPIEIRRLIWVNALPSGRIQLFAKSIPWEEWRLLPPVIAHVCREARETVWNLAVVRGFPTAHDRHNETWFLASRDILELASGYPYPMSNPAPFFAAAETLAVNAGDFESGDVRAVLRDLIEEPSRFRSARRVYLIVDQVSTAFWPKFRADLTPDDKGKGTLLDLCSGADLGKIEEYAWWARCQEMAPAFPHLRDIVHGLKQRLDAAIMDGLMGYRETLPVAYPCGPDGPVVPPPPSSMMSPDHPWVQQQQQRLPEFRPAILVLGWT